jgi:hypothetical protein
MSDKTTSTKAAAMPGKTDGKTWSERYSIASSNQSAMFQKFADWYDLMYAHMNTSKYALWRSKVFLPIVPSKAWSMIAKLQALSPGFEVGLYGDALNDDKLQENANKMQWILERDWDNPCFDEPMADKEFSSLVDAVVAGTGIAKVPRTYESHTRYQHVADPEDDESYDMTKDERIDSFRGYNDLIPHDIFATFIAPGSKTLQKAPWIILEDFTTYQELVDTNKSLNPDGKDQDKYHNLDKVKDLKATNDPNAQYKKSRERLTTSEDDITTDTTLAQFRRYECYEKSTGDIYTFVAGQTSSGDTDEWIEIECRKNPFWHGKYPLVMFYVKKRPHSIWGQGVFEDTERLQSAFNDTFNHYMDQLNMTDGMITRKSNDAKFSYIVEPGGEILYENDKPDQFKFPEPSEALFTMALNFIEAQVEDATISSYAQGTPNSATDKTTGTATGIQALQTAAGDKIGAFKQNFATTLRQVGSMWLSNNQQFTDEDTVVMGTEKGKRKAVTVKPKDLQGRMSLRINEASMEPETKEQRVAKFLAYLQQLQALQAASLQQAQSTKWATKPIYVDYVSLVQDLSDKMGEANFDKILLDNAEVEKAMQASETPMVLPNERINITPADLKPSEMMQLLQRNGIQPDPSRQQDAPVTTNQAANTPPATEEPPAPQITPDHLLAANAQDHSHALETAKLALEVRKQLAGEAQAAATAQAQPQEEPQPVGATSGR